MYGTRDKTLLGIHLAHLLKLEENTVILEDFNGIEQEPWGFTNLETFVSLKKSSAAHTLHFICVNHVFF